MGKIFSTVIITLLTTLVWGQGIPGAQQMGLGYSSMVRCDNSFSFFSNPASTAELNETKIGFFFSPSPFGLDQLRCLSTAVIYPLRQFTASAGCTTYGFDLYRETKITAGVAAEAAANVLAGISVTLENLSIKNYGSASTLMFNGGFVYLFTRELRAGFSITNFTRSSIGQGNTLLPVQTAVGFQWAPSSIRINFSVEKESDRSATTHTGFEYLLPLDITIMAGYTTYPAIPSGGIVFRAGPASFTYAMQYHNILGSTHCIELELEL
ncbi:MAG: hypothetical protein LWX56_13570 [Ignavibacteria bacterium]|nr:hypothetical protein [Ignavibacteria bacterium]